MSSAYSPEQIRRLAEVIARELMPRKRARVPRRLRPAGGAFSNLDDAVAAAAVAFKALDALGLEKRREVIESMRDAMRRNAQSLAALAVEETGLGRAEDKVQKNLLVTNKTPGPEELTPTAASGDHGLVLVEPAPFGVIGAITPVTNPSSTIICNSIGMVAAGNTVVFNPHPSAARGLAGDGPPSRRGDREGGGSAERRRLHGRADHPVGGRAHEAPPRPPARRHGRRRRRGRRDELRQARDLRRARQPARGRRRDRRHREGGTRHRLRALVRQQRHLHRREGSHRRRLDRRRAEGRDEEGRGVRASRAATSPASRTSSSRRAPGRAATRSSTRSSSGRTPR